MKENCLDIGTIQAFLDRELDHAATARVSSHVAACRPCASLLAHADDESTFVFSALEREFDTLVPTQRLWSKINDAIETERREAPVWQKAWAYLRLSLLSPSIAVAAALILVVGIFAMYWLNRTTPAVNVPVRDIVATTAEPTVIAPAVNPPATGPKTTTTEPSFKIERASYRPGPRRGTTQASSAPHPVTPATDAMPGEESYVKTIATLGKSVDEKKDTVLRPSQRIAYERDMAVVDDAIAKMRQEVKRNPKNQSARQVLYSSYQNKIDLLNSVSQKEELMASMR